MAGPPRSTAPGGGPATRAFCSRFPTLCARCSPPFWLQPATVMSVVSFAPVADFRRPTLDALWAGSAPISNAGVMSEVAQIYPTAAEDLVCEKLVPTAMQGAMKSLTTDQWQLITHERLGNQLYDHTRDPHELKDVFSATD